MIPARVSLAGLLLMVAAVVGCRDLTGLDTECVTHDRLGQFNARLSGASTDSVIGCAYFGRQVINGVGFTGVIFTMGGPRSPEHLKLQKQGNFGVGTTPISNPEPPINSPFGAVFLGLLRFDIKAGSVTVTDNQNPTLRGSIDLTAVTESGDTLTIRGSFFARCIESNQNVPPTDADISDPARNGLCNPFPPGAGLRAGS